MPTNRRRRTRTGAGISEAAMLAFLRGDPPPPGTTAEIAARLTSNWLFPERFPLPVTRWWAEYGQQVLRTWRRDGRPWGEWEAEAGAEQNHPKRHRGIGIFVLQHPHIHEWNAVARPPQPPLPPPLHKRGNGAGG